ncbi:MAG: hypothetical protein O7B26_11985, partial [Planctomycetota bacterium]|nr:hypothetical protein [Planctomycetota bacterium]
MPRTRRGRYAAGTFRPRHKHLILPVDHSDDALVSAARRLRRLAQATHGADWRIAATGSVTNAAGTILIERADSGRNDQGYTLRIRPNTICLRAAGDVGLHYGVTTLGQLLGSGR